MNTLFLIVVMGQSNEKAKAYARLSFQPELRKGEP
jgi:hypothetical protein